VGKWWGRSKKKMRGVRGWWGKKKKRGRGRIYKGNRGRERRRMGKVGILEVVKKNNNKNKIVK
jgi:hypothetical protein